MSYQGAEVYREEAHELLAELESSLLELEQSPSDEDLIAGIFRAMHTIKGSGAMFGFDNIAAFTHDIETIYDLIRGKIISADKDIVQLTLSACDQIRAMIDGTSDIDAEEAQHISRAFRGRIPATASNAGEALKAVIKEDAPFAEITYRIRFQPHADIFANGTSLSPLLGELKALGPCTVTAQTDPIPPFAQIDPENCYVFWDIVLTTRRGENAVKDVFIFVEDHCTLTIEAIDAPSGRDNASVYKKLGEILTERGDVAPSDVELALGSQKKLGEVLVESGLVSPDLVGSALIEQQHIRDVREKRQATEQTATLRVPAEKLDRLVDRVGELVTVQSRLSRLASRIQDADLALVAEEVERLTSDLRDNTMSIRMLPIGNTFGKFKRLVHDLSVELGKDIDLIIEGGETELDKTVIEKLNDPLVHLIRNSIDHGIESPAERRRRGKPDTGTIRLSAQHAGANVLISISDDGAGIDAEAVRRKAVSLNLIAEDARLSERDIFALIFFPGFSLAESVTSVSGRGVGMDVVKKSIDSLGGSIEIASAKGAGSVITLKLPLTLAIIDGLLVKIEDAFFVIPLSAIEECVELTREDVKKAHGRNFINIRGDIVPYIHLRDRFVIAGTPPAIEQIIINRVNGDRIGLVVDQVVGEHQTVIKNMGKYYRQIKEVSGATILGDGTVALILDIPCLLSSAMMDEQRAGASAFFMHPPPAPAMMN